MFVYCALSMVFLCLLDCLFGWITLVQCCALCVLIIGLFVLVRMSVSVGG